MKVPVALKLVLILGVPAAVVVCQLLLGWFFGGAVTFAGLCLLAFWAPGSTSRRSQDVTKQSRPSPAAAASLVEKMLAEGRYALLLRPQLIGNLSAAQRRRAQQEMDRLMAVVPAGEVLMMRRTKRKNEAEQPHDPIESVAAFYLDRYPVTNRQFYQFVAAGGYHQMSLWDEEVLPALLAFVDDTDTPSPRLWRNGTYPAGKENHPVVGLSWFEADAYARWLGKRLPTDPEWIKAAAWPVSSTAERPVQRKYPWGETMDRQRANVWGSKRGDTVPVTDFADGVSVGGIYQMIGNVWEWTNSGFGQWEDDARWLESNNLPKSLRGGAFDTYLENQATSDFQSGDCPLARKRNIGFRCALSLADLQNGVSRKVVEGADVKEVLA